MTKTKGEIDELLPKDISKPSEFEAFYKELVKEVKI